MVRLVKITTFLFCACLAMAAQAANVKLAESEFKRAISIIENTQLELFTDTPPADSADILQTLESRFIDRSEKLDPQTPDNKKNKQELRIALMRSLLSETIEAYSDQYANYITPDALKRYQERRSGNYEGVGLKFRTVADEYPLVIGPIIDGPLDHSDLLPGDKIIEANGYDLKGLTNSQVVGQLKGPAKSPIDLKLKRNGKIFHVVGRRGPVELKYADAEIIKDNIGYIKISRFGGNTHKEVRKLLGNLIDHKVSGIILDLRDNPGGSTRAARAIVSMFSEEPWIYFEKNKAGAIKQLPRHGEYMTDLPLAVLINGDSMSSSEIVAGALKSFGRGTLIGSPSFGKGLVQRVFNLKMPLGGAIRTTIAEFGTPDHQPIHGAGITPDISLETSADFMFRRSGSLNIRDNAKAFQRALLEESVRKDHADKADVLINATDAQLNRAIDEITRVTSSADLKY